MAKKNQKQTRRKFGKLRKLPSGRYQASFIGLDGERYKARHTFVNEVSAENWLSDEERLINRSIDYGDPWINPSLREVQEEQNNLTVKELCELWLNGSPTIKKESSRASHRRRLNARVYRDSFPGFDSLANEKVADVDRKRIAAWWGQVQQQYPDQAPTNTGAYKNLHTAFEYARNTLEIIDVNPVQVAGATAKTKSKVRDQVLLQVSELSELAEAIYPRLRVPVLILGWCGLRLGELLELRLKDIHDKAGVMTIKVRRNAQRIKNPKTDRYEMVPSTPKTDAGNRDIVVPKKIAIEVRKHLKEYVASDPEALIVTTERGKRMIDTSFRSRFNIAAKKIGRDDITPHSLRRFYGTLLVNNSGVGMEEARRLMGHETVEQLMEYQRASANYEQQAASNLDKLI